MIAKCTEFEWPVSDAGRAEHHGTTGVVDALP